jgi:uracil-DNA glycosylase family 4
MDRERVERLVKQAAETSRLLGVDFVPAYGAVAAPESLPPSAPVTAVEAVAPRPVPARPAPSRIDTDSGPMLAARLPLCAIEIKARSREPGDVQAALDELRARYEQDAPHQHFVTAHTRIVFGEGHPCARLMFIGEAPGAEEDKTGRPFVGRAGQLLNKMIAAMGLAREAVYIANVLKTRPPDNATPTSDEIRLCAPYLFQQVAIIQPEAIVTLGLPATRALLDTMESMSRLRGRWASFSPPPPAPGPIPVMPTYHPAFLLRSYTDENRAKVWSDLQQVMKRLVLAKT